MQTSRKMNIVIAGIGGVGGYLGGKLAYHYANSQHVKINFIARGEHGNSIRDKGLELISGGVTFSCRPSLTTDDPSEIGLADLFIICSKNNAVLDIVNAYAACITSNTFIITTQNGVSGKERIASGISNSATLMQGCIYIASNIIEPGKVAHLSGPASLTFGTDGQIDNKGESLVKIFTDAGIDATFTNDISAVLWKKFMFVSPAAVVTALFKIPFPFILQSNKAKDLFVSLVSELMQLANAKNIMIDEHTIENNLIFLGKFTGEAKSSFQLDLEKNKPTEIDALVKYVLSEAENCQVPVPFYHQAFVKLKEMYPMLADY